VGQPVYLLNGVASVADGVCRTGAWLWNLANAHLGTAGATALFLVAAVIGFLFVYKLVELLLAIIKYLVLPALLLAALATLVLNVSFLVALPVCALACSLVLVVKS